MNTTVMPLNGNGGIVPPWLRKPQPPICIPDPDTPRIMPIPERGK